MDKMELKDFQGDKKPKASPEKRLKKAILKQHMDTFVELFEQESIDVHWVDSSQSSFVHDACFVGNIKVKKRIHPPPKLKPKPNL